ncbi:MAG: iron-sulfur cluster carrier protein ApbC [Salinisphaeraceae bacterium]|nr:iron-sulfur cluster carrier protein ApbC [Salinisphaeraceae bacterium]
MLESPGNAKSFFDPATYDLFKPDDESPMSEAAIQAALAEYVEPHLQTDLVSAGAVEQVRFDNGQASVVLNFGFPCEEYAKELKARLAERLIAIDGISEADIRVNWQVESHAVQANLQPLANIKNIIAVASGKGGVGKSTVSANLALALAAEGAKVGVLDADIYGPSQPRMLGATTKPEQLPNKKLKPVMTHGIATMSIGYLVDEAAPMIWRGPMVTQALQQLLGETEWPALDYLIVDLPPGTGDIQLSLAQRIPVSGAVIVTTPQDIALLDARKGLMMFRKLEIQVLGVVENMSTHVCSQCGHEEAIFGSGGGQSLAAEHSVNLLGQLPLDLNIRQRVDSGYPSVLADPDGEIAARFRSIARQAAAQLTLGSDDEAFPEISITDD